MIREVLRIPPSGLHGLGLCLFQLHSHLLNGMPIPSYPFGVCLNVTFQSRIILHSVNVLQPFYS
jgi:hypothetical protein